MKASLLWLWLFKEDGWMNEWMIARLLMYEYKLVSKHCCIEFTYYENAIARDLVLQGTWEPVAAVSFCLGIS